MNRADKYIYLLQKCPCEICKKELERFEKEVSQREIERKNAIDRIKNNPFLRDIRECYVRKDDD